MQLQDLPGRTCVIGVLYLDPNGEVLQQAQYAGEVAKVDAEMGITVRLRHSDPAAAQADFILPPNLAAWFKAPPGRYRHAPSGVDIENPDFLVTWNVYRQRDGTREGKHEWWEWVPNTAQPQVGAPPESANS